MDSPLRIDGLPDVRVSDVTATREARIAHLGDHWGQSGAVHCLCHGPPGIAMGVARRRRPQLTYYLYPLRADDGARHHPDCPHHIEPAELSADDTPHSRTTIVAGPAERPALGHALDTPIQHGLQVLIHRLWHLAELDIWHPRFAGRRTYGVVQRRLIDAAADVSYEGRACTDTFLVPPRYRPRKASYCTRVLADWMRAVCRAGEGLTLGLFKSLEQETLRLRHLSVGLRLDEALAEKLKNLWPLQAQPCVILARVQCASGPAAFVPRTRVTVDSVVAMPLADDDTYMPALSSDEVDLASELIAGERAFHRPSKSEVGLSRHAIGPAYLLTDTTPATVLEINDSQHQPDARHLALDRADCYQDAGFSLWRWDSRLACPTLPEPD